MVDCCEGSLLIECVRAHCALPRGMCHEMMNFIFHSLHIRFSAHVGRCPCRVFVFLASCPHVCQRNPCDKARYDGFQRSKCHACSLHDQPKAWGADQRRSTYIVTADSCICSASFAAMRFVTNLLSQIASRAPSQCWELCAHRAHCFAVQYVCLHSKTSMLKGIRHMAMKHDLRSQGSYEHESRWPLSWLAHDNAYKGLVLLQRALWLIYHANVFDNYQV